MIAFIKAEAASIVRWLNWLAAFIAGGVLLVNSTHPEIVTGVEDALPLWAKVAASILWFALVDYLTKRAAKNG